MRARKGGERGWSQLVAGGKALMTKSAESAGPECLFVGEGLGEAAGSL